MYTEHMKNYVYAGVVLLIVGLIGTGTLFLARQHAEAPAVACTMEAKVCPDGSAVGRTGPNCEFAPCPEIPEAPSEEPIVIDAPQSGASITSPVSVSGTARGTWFFEGSAPVSIVDWDGKIIGEGYVTAQGDWMTTEFVPFTGTITYTIDPNTPYDRGAIIFKKDNPSGLPEHDDAREIPIVFSELQAEGTGATDPGLGESEPVVCTMEARQCPDGSYVGRTGPSCQFAPCPGGEKPIGTLEVQ